MHGELWFVDYEGCVKHNNYGTLTTLKNVRFQIIRNARIDNLCNYQSCMVSKLQLVREHIVLTYGRQ